jgi:adenosylmethionine-8-amino-7-oxononanoate aminotransferase
VALYPGRGTADGVAGDHVIVAPPLNVTEEELRVVVGVLEEAYRHVEREVDGNAVDGSLDSTRLG